MKAHLLTNASTMDDINQDAENGATGGHTSLLQQQQQQKMVRQNLEFERGMYLEREQRFREIESDILDANKIMRELSSLVEMQNESIGKCL